MGICHLIIYFIYFITKILLRNLNFSLNRTTRGNSKTDIFIPRRKIRTESLNFTEIFEVSRCLRYRKPKLLAPDFLLILAHPVYKM